MSKGSGPFKMNTFLLYDMSPRFSPIGVGPRKIEHMIISVINALVRIGCNEMSSKF